MQEEFDDAVSVSNTLIGYIQRIALACKSKRARILYALKCMCTCTHVQVHAIVCLSVCVCVYVCVMCACFCVCVCVCMRVRVSELMQLCFGLSAKFCRLIMWF